MRFSEVRLYRVGVFLALLGLASVGLAAEEAIEVAENLFAELLILFGCAFILTAGVGMYRFPDFYARLHASSKLVTLGGVGIFGGAALLFAPFGVTPRVLLVAAFFLLTAPLAGYMIARAGYLRGLEPYKEEGSVDEWDVCGVASDDIAAEDELSTVPLP